MINYYIVWPHISVHYSHGPTDINLLGAGVVFDVGKIGLHELVADFVLLI